jgi:hypothetical protein
MTRRHPLDPVSLVFGFTFTAAGLLFLSGQLDQALRLRWLWPVLLLALGVGILLDAGTRRRPPEDRPEPPAQPAQPAEPAEVAEVAGAPARPAEVAEPPADPGREAAERVEPPAPARTAELDPEPPATTTAELDPEGPPDRDR